MNAKDFLRLGVALGEATRRATDFVAQYVLRGGDTSKLEGAHLDTAPRIGVFGSSSDEKENPSTSTMNDAKKKFRSLAEMEEEVLAEGQEWMRQRLQQKLQEQARQIGAPFPPRQPSVGSSPQTKTDAARPGRRTGR
jgi:hypothetical protein